MNKPLITHTDDALNEFRELSSRVLRELDEHRALVAEYDELVRRQRLAVDAAVQFMVAAALAMRDVRENEAAVAAQASVCRPVMGFLP